MVSVLRSILIASILLFAGGNGIARSPFATAPPPQEGQPATPTVAQQVPPFTPYGSLGQPTNPASAYQTPYQAYQPSYPASDQAPETASYQTAYRSPYPSSGQPSCGPSQEINPFRRSADRFHLILESKPNTPVMPSGGRKSFFQKVDANLLWAPSGSGKGVGITEVGFGATLAMPFPSPKTPLLITPSASLTFLDPGDANRFDYPDSLYSTRLGLMWLAPLGTKTMFSLGASPSWNSDFRQDSDKALRVPVHFGLLWLCNPRTRIMIGAAYLDRSDYPWIPFAGLTWTPTPDWCFEIGAPRTRISRRVFFDRFPGLPRTTPSVLPSANGLPEAFDPSSDNSGYWMYVGGDFGGGTWAVKRDDGESDLFLYNDFKIVFGLEYKRPLALNWGVEAGWMFGRELKYDSGYDEFDPESMFFLRFRASY